MLYEDVNENMEILPMKFFLWSYRYFIVDLTLYIFFYGDAFRDIKNSNKI